MFKHILLIFFFLGIFLMPSQAKVYTNPIILERPMPDPSVIEDGSGNFYMYATNSDKKVPIYTSRDLINWKYIGSAFSPDQMPTGLDGWGIWAPEVVFHNGKYLMAYAYSKGGEYQKNGIGLGIADSPKGPFKNLGMLFTSDSSGVRNSIDPSFVVEGENLYLLWGSYFGIYMVELKWNNNSDYFIDNINSKIQMAIGDLEGSHIFKRGEYYYLFASAGYCCDGDKSSYRVVVGRSKNILGPYIDSDGYKMTDYGYNFVVGGNRKFVGPGHGSTIITDKEGKTWYIYHSYERGKSDKGRKAMLDEIKWDSEGWPYIYKGEPSIGEMQAPVF